VELKLGSLNDGIRIRLQDVYYAPALKSKIISERQCTAVRFTVSKKAEECILQKGDLILQAHNDPRYNLWILTGMATSNECEEVNAITRSQTMQKLSKNHDRPTIPVKPSTIGGDNESDFLQLLHNRLGHVNHQYLEQYMHHHNLRATPDGTECETCSMTKSRQKPVPKEVSRKPEHPLHIVHADLMGPFPASNSGKCYALLITDGYSRYTCIFFLKHKSDAAAAIQAYVKDTEILLSQQVESSGATTAVNSSMRKYSVSLNPRELG
jgi:hypothetical protein